MSTPRLTATPMTSLSGQRPLLVLGSSLGTTHTLWSSVVPLLGDAFDVVAVDHPGHALVAAEQGADVDTFDMAELAAAFLDAVDGTVGARRRFRFAGVSLGGAVGLQLLLDHAERVDSALVICSGAFLGPAEAWEERAALVRAHGTGGILELSRERWFAPEFAESHPVVAGTLLDQLARVDDDGYVRCCEALAGFDVRSRLPEIDRPLVVMSGEVDGAAPPEMGALVADGVPGARQVVLPGVGHLPPVEAPRAIAAQLLHGMPRSEGMRVRRQVLGDAHVDRATARIDDTTRDFQDLITRYAWGEVWTRPGLDRRSRSLVTLATLVAGHHWNELELHLRAAVLANGLSREEVTEVLLQCAVYCSVPSANTAFGVAQSVFRSLDEEAR